MINFSLCKLIPQFFKNYKSVYSIKFEFKRNTNLESSPKSSSMLVLILISRANFELFWTINWNKFNLEYKVCKSKKGCYLGFTRDD